MRWAKLSCGPTYRFDCAFPFGMNSILAFFQPVTFSISFHQGSSALRDLNSTADASRLHTGGRIDCIAEQLESSTITTKYAGCYRSLVVEREASR